MTKAAAALGVAVLNLTGCSADTGNQAAPMVAAIQQFAREFPGEAVCLHRSFVLRRPAESRAGAFIESAPPAGFESLRAAQSASVDLTPNDIEADLPDRWYIGDGGKEMCFEFSHPRTRGDRALVSVEIHGEIMGFGRRDYWLLRKGRSWTVVARTDGGMDI